MGVDEFTMFYNLPCFIQFTVFYKMLLLRLCCCALKKKIQKKNHNNITFLFMEKIAHLS